MDNLPARLRAMAHIESAALAPHVSPLGQAAREAADEIDRLNALVDAMQQRINGTATLGFTETKEQMDVRDVVAPNQ